MTLPTPIRKPVLRKAPVQLGERGEKATHGRRTWSRADGSDANPFVVTNDSQSGDAVGFG